MGMNSSQSRFLKLTHNQPSVQKSAADVAKRNDALADQTRKQSENLFEMKTGTPEARFTFSTLSGDELDAFLNDFNEKMDNANNTFGVSKESLEAKADALDKEMEAYRQVANNNTKNSFKTFS